MTSSPGTGPLSVNGSRLRGPFGGVWDRTGSGKTRPTDDWEFGSNAGRAGTRRALNGEVKAGFGAVPGTPSSRRPVFLVFRFGTLNLTGTSSSELSTTYSGSSLPESALSDDRVVALVGKRAGAV